MPKTPENWPAFNTEKRPINELLPYVGNSKDHPDEQVEYVISLIQQFGFTTPVLVDPDGEIIAGHCRVMALRKMGYDFVPVIVARGWSEEQKRLYVIADNRSQEMGTWNEDRLSVELSKLSDADVDLSLTGFDDDEISRLLDIDLDEPPPEKQKKKPKKIDIDTEVWVLGSHKLVAGGGVDSSELCWIIEAWQKKTRKAAIRESDGVKYDDIAFEKAPTSQQTAPDTAQKKTTSHKGAAPKKPARKTAKKKAETAKRSRDKAKIARPQPQNEAQNGAGGQ